MNYEKLIEQFGLLETYTLPDGTLLRGVHSRLKCAGRPCVVHNPSDHHMRDLPLHWRDDRRMFERICRHGIGHPDPDALAFQLSLPTGDDGWGVHGCCGICCTP
jgi:hypothetical protein